MFSLLLLLALKKAMDFRSDGAPQLDYTFGSDYGVSTTPFSFFFKGRVLRGERFFLPNQKYKGVLVFFHGMGAGYTSYTQEICYFALHGYLVYAFDYLGCMTSEGKGIGSLCEPVRAQKEFFRFLDKDEPAQGLDRFALGHSWGGFAALAACREEFGVKAIASIAGFTSCVDMICRRSPKLEKFRFLIHSALRLGYGKFAASDMVDAIRHARARILYLQGEADTAVLPEDGIKKIRAAFPNDPRITCVEVPAAGHNPYWTKQAQLYMMEIVREHHIASRNFDNQFVVDYGKLNVDDPAFMKSILDFFDNIDKPLARE